MERFVEYLGNHPWLTGATFLLVVIIIAYEIRVRQSKIGALSPQEAIRLMNQGALVLDLRGKEEFAAGHLAGARQMPSDQILNAAESLKKYKEKPVLVYCGTGPVGAAAVRQLIEQGFTKAFHLRGGVAAWRAEGLPLTKG